jgi:hypothetical protein
VDARRVALAGREEVDDEEVDALADQLRRLRGEGVQLAAAGLVAGGNDLDHGHDVPMSVAHGDAIRLAGIGIDFVAPDVACPRRGAGDGHAYGETGNLFGPGSQLQGQHIRDRAAYVLSGEGEVSRRQPPRVQRVAQGDYPPLMKGVKQARIDAGPVVDWHDRVSREAEMQITILLLSGTGWRHSCGERLVYRW